MKTLIAFLLICSQAFAASICVRTTEKSCAPGGGCTIAHGYGSAVVINKTESGCWVAITAKHVVENATRDKIHVCMLDGWVQVENVYLLKSDDDAAFVTFRYDGDLKQSFVSEDEVAPGEPIKFSGYSGGTTFEKSGGKVVQAGCATADVRPRHGQSGGGVYDRHGRLIGTVTGYDQAGNLVYCPISRVRQRCVRQWGFFWGVGVGVHAAPARPIVVVPPPPVIVAPPMPMPVPFVDAPAPPINVLPARPADNGLAAIKAQLADLRLMIEQSRCACDKSKTEARLKALENVVIPVEILREDGTIFDRAEYKLGHPIKLQLAPAAEAPADATAPGAKAP